VAAELPALIPESIPTDLPMGVDHYENFPVASVLMPPSLRSAVRAIYAFARHADDLADEGDVPPGERLRALDDLGAQLDAIEAGAPTRWPALAEAVCRHELPLQPLRDLLSAFRQDVTTHRYDDYPALLDYCRRSANPVGRLMLALYGDAEPESLRQSDAVCTGLQLVNFWQDVASDWARGRVYLPQSELRAAGLDDAAIGRAAAGAPTDDRWPALMGDQTRRAAEMLVQGAPLARRIGGRIGLELRMVIEGGLRIAQRIDAVGGDVFRRRPTLGSRDWLVVAARAFGRLATGS